MKTVSSIVLACALAVSWATAPANAQPQAGLKIGVLTCTKVPGGGVNLIVYSSTMVECEMHTAGGVEKYSGRSGIALGIDLEWNDSEVVTYAVFGFSGDVRPGEHPLAGEYVGAEASATAGVGLGVRTLIGAGPNHLTLQPLGIETGTGFGVAAGLSYLHLFPAGPSLSSVEPGRGPRTN